MYERMLNKQIMPDNRRDDPILWKNTERFSLLHQWLAFHFATEQKAVFPYGSHSCWGIAHKVKKNLICNLFAEKDAFSVIMNLSKFQYDSLSQQLGKYAHECIQGKCFCGDDGWIQYRVTCAEHF